MRRLDAAYFRVGEAKGGLLVKFCGDDPTPVNELRGALERDGLGVSRLEGEGRLRFVAERAPAGERIMALRRVLDEEGPGRPVWASFDWAEGVDLEEALRHQGADAIRGGERAARGEDARARAAGRGVVAPLPQAGARGAPGHDLGVRRSADAEQDHPAAASLSPSRRNPKAPRSGRRWRRPTECSSPPVR
jgi:hypothetical protein